MNSTEDAHKLQKKNSRDEHGAWKNRASDGLLMVHATAALPWSATGRIHKLQAPGSGHKDPGESETPQRAMWLFGGRDSYKISLNQWRITTDQYSDYKRGKTFTLESLLYLVLGSWFDGGKWILFSVDRVNVRTSWESSLWIADGVTQLLSTKNLKEIVGKDKLVHSKLLEE